MQPHSPQPTPAHPNPPDHGLPRILWAIILLAVVLRVGAALYLGNTVEPLPGTYDQVSYDMLAQRVAGGHAT